MIFSFIFSENPCDYLGDLAQDWLCESGFLGAFIDIYVGF